MGAIAGESKITLLAASGAGDDGSLVCVVVVEEEVGGAVEREGGDWEVGETDEEGREGVADSAVAVERRNQSDQNSVAHMARFLQWILHADNHGIELAATSPNLLQSFEHVHTLSLSTVAGWGLAPSLQYMFSMAST